MKFVHPEINYLFNTENDKVNTIIIENQSFFTSIIADISNQINGDSGKSVLSENDELIPFEKNAEIIDRFIPFDLNKKSLVTKITGLLEKSSANEEFYEKTMVLLGELEKFLYELSYDIDCTIDFPKLSVSSIIKAASPELRDDYENLGEKILDYMEYVKRFEKNKTFFIINLRSYMNDTQIEFFMKSVISHGLDVIMIDNKANLKCQWEKRLIIDSDLCEIV